MIKQKFPPTHTSLFFLIVRARHHWWVKKGGEIIRRVSMMMTTQIEQHSGRQHTAMMRRTHFGISISTIAGEKMRNKLKSIFDRDIVRSVENRSSSICGDGINVEYKFPLDGSGSSQPVERKSSLLTSSPVSSSIHAFKHIRVVEFSS